MAGSSLVTLLKETTDAEMHTTVVSTNGAQASLHGSRMAVVLAWLAGLRHQGRDPRREAVADGARNGRQPHDDPVDVAAGGSHRLHRAVGSRPGAERHDVRLCVGDAFHPQGEVPERFGERDAGLEKGRTPGQDPRDRRSTVR